MLPLALPQNIALTVRKAPTENRATWNDPQELYGSRGAQFIRGA